MVSDEALAGGVVAYTEARVGQVHTVVVRSMSTGRVLHDVSLYVATPQGTMVEQAHVLHIAVNGEGAVAWIQEDGFGRHDDATPPPTVYDVFAIDSDRFHSLRTDLPARPGSLKLTGDALVDAGRNARVGCARLSLRTSRRCALSLRSAHLQPSLISRRT